MPSNSPPGPRRPTAQLRDPQRAHGFFASVGGCLQSLLCCTDTPRHDEPSHLSNIPQGAIIVVEDSEGIHNSVARSRNVSSAVSLPLSEARSRGENSSFHGSERSGNQPQKSTVGSELFVSQYPSRMGASAFHSAQDVSFSGNAQFYNVETQQNVHVNNYGGTQALNTLQQFVAFDALYDSSAQDPERQCHPGTRESILMQISNWVDNPNATQRILWLRGPAGAGKSAIAQTISRSRGRDKVAATFFFFRSDSKRNDGNYLFPTVAWQLAKSIPGVKDKLAKALDDDPDIPRKAIEDQFKLLIAAPLHAIAENETYAQPLAPIVIIDGVDECTEVKIQQRFLNCLKHAVSTTHIPLRFLISSRPEAHITEALKQFEHTTLVIDLADADHKYRDVEKYLQEKFAEIASRQDIDPTTWPSREVIQQLIFKSSGHFIYASTIIKFISDEDCDARSQLAIVQGLEPINDASPFAALDALYIEILRRQRHQSFLQDFLRILVFHHKELAFSRNDDALLLNLDWKGLVLKLRGMHSLLKLRDSVDIDVHHRSFFDFLQESARSGQYYINKKSATRRYWELLVDALVRHASRVLKNPSYHGSTCFAPEFGNVLRIYRREIRIPLQDWEEVLYPLMKIKDESLKFLDRSSLWKQGLCDGCSTFYIIDDLLAHLAFLRGISHPIAFPSEQEPQSVSVLSPTAMEGSQNFPDNLDGTLSSLLHALRDKQTCESMTTIECFCAILRFDPYEIASKVRSVSDAQNLIDFIHFITNRKRVRKFRGQDLARNAPLLALQVYVRIPTIPRFLLDGAAVRSDGGVTKYQGKTVKTWGTLDSRYGINAICQEALIWGTLAHDNIAPLLGIREEKDGRFSFIYDYPKNGNLRQWRRKSPSVAEIQKRIFEVAKVIQYLYSLGIVLLVEIEGTDIGLDSDFHVQVPVSCISSRYHDETPLPYRGLPDWAMTTCTYESGVFMFGCLFYEVYFDIDIDNPSDVTNSRKIIAQCPDKPKIDSRAWQLIQRCCEKDPKKRPAMNQVVDEMESWKLV